MSYVLKFVGGPRDGQSEEKRGVPQTIPYLTDESPGLYRATEMKKSTATLIWIPKPKRVTAVNAAG